ncbi:hypothetical protein QQF64_017991 [Cirrhinus molitorella]|uniref:Uncharacterized protein n=1 Tax=Cirrhinus molitorella TaxID=172907 RepID=A0ABR3LK92_9TELE
MRKNLQTAGSLTRLKTGSASLVLLGSRVTLPAREVQISLSLSPSERGSNQTPALLPLIGYFPPEQEPSHQQHEASL